jgi:hypothetical protein
MSEQGRMETARANFNTFWQDVADRVDPAGGNFTVTRTPGTQNQEKQFDSTATMALSRTTASFEAMCTPRNQKWQGLVPSGESDDQAVKVYLERLRDLLFRVRYGPRANFANQNSESLRQVLAYGNTTLFVDDDPGRSLRYKVIGLAESFFAEDHSGRIDRFHRKFKLKARQILAQFPDAPFSSLFRGAAEKQPDTEFDLLHRVCPNQEIDVRRGDYRGMPIMGCYVMPAEQLILDESGFRTMPYCVGRYRVSARENYGRGPVMDLLPSIKTVNEMQKTNLRTGQRLAAPPLLAYRDGLAAPFNLRSDHVNYGGLDDQGRPLVRPLDSNGQLPVSLEMQNAERDVIKEGLLNNIFEIMRDNPNMTATQTLQLVQERGVLMSPPVGNLQSGLYGPMTERELDLMANIGGGAWLESQIGPMPKALIDAGGLYEIEYSSPLNKAMDAEEAIAIQNGLEQAATLAQFDPSIPKVLDLRGAFRRMLEIRGFPSGLIFSDADLQEADAADAQQAQLAGMLGAAPIIGQTAKDLAQAQALAGSAPQQTPGIGALA